MDDYRDLLRLRPGLSLAFAATLLSLAGIPLTRLGFIARLFAVASGVDGHHAVLPGTLVTGSITCLHHYLRIIGAMAAPAGPMPVTARSRREIRAERPGHAVLAALVLLLTGLGAYPASLLTLIRTSTSMVARRSPPWWGAD